MTISLKSVFSKTEAKQQNQNRNKNVLLFVLLFLYSSRQDY